MIELKNIKKIYKSKKGTDTLALNNVNLKINEKGLLFIVGKSGSGKSTLLNILGGLDSPTDGELLINGKNICNFKNKEYDSYRNTYVGFIFQEFNLLEEYNVYENIELSVKLQKSNISRDKIDEVLNSLGIKDLGKRKINELSGGQKQRVAIARALIKRPKLIIADEPTGNLDQKSSEQIFSILKEISKSELVIVVSHDIESANKYADRIINIEDGTIIKDTGNIENIGEKELPLKKSTLPSNYAIIMAIKSLSAKPFKLTSTILITALALIFMGFAINSALYNGTDLIINTMKDNKQFVYNILKIKVNADGSSGRIEITNDDIKEIADFTKSKINTIYSLNNNGADLNFEYGEFTEDNQFQTIPSPKFIELKDNRILNNITGKIPKNSDELAISKKTANFIIKFGIIDETNTLYFPKDYNELVNCNKTFKMGNNNVKIVGVLNDNVISSIDGYDFHSDDIYVNGFVSNVKLEFDRNRAKKLIALIGVEKIFAGVETIDNNLDIITAGGIKNIKSLEKNEAIISLYTLKEVNEEYNIKLEEYLSSNNGNYIELIKKFTVEYMKEVNLFAILNLRLMDARDSNKIKETKIKVIGISLDNNIYVGQSYVDEYNPTLKEIAYLQIYDDNVDNLKRVFSNYTLEYLTDGVTGIHTAFDVSYSSKIGETISIYKYLFKYILIVSLIFVLFTLLLFSNFISVSISYCKKQIGILRAMGAKSTDILKIFGYESIIIGMLSWIIAMILWFTGMHLLNVSVYGKYLYTFKGFMTHPIIPLGMLVYTLIISLLITLISISSVAKVKPIDAINNK